MLGCQAGETRPLTQGRNQDTSNALIFYSLFNYKESFTKMNYLWNLWYVIPLRRLTRASGLSDEHVWPSLHLECLLSGLYPVHIALFFSFWTVSCQLALSLSNCCWATVGILLMPIFKNNAFFNHSLSCSIHLSCIHVWSLSAGCWQMGPTWEGVALQAAGQRLLRVTAQV